jgi:hypothetical protein
MNSNNLIVMMTHNDLTVENASDFFEECKSLPVEYWGFKNVGIEENDMRDLIYSIKTAGKKAILEVVTYTEETCMTAARFACEHSFDYLMGTLYFSSVWNYLRSHSIEYFPFIGNVSGSPSVLTGCADGMVTQANSFYEQEIPGVNILAYRYRNGDPVALAKNVVSQIKTKAIIAGSIDSIERMETVKSVNPWGFTMGSALFSQKFVNGKSSRANLEKVLEVMNSLGMSVA